MFEVDFLVLGKYKCFFVFGVFMVYRCDVDYWWVLGILISVYCDLLIFGIFKSIGISGFID